MSKRFHVYRFACLFLMVMLLAACGPSAEEVITMTAAAWTDTPTATATVTVTNTPTATSTCTPTPTPTPLGGGLLVVSCKPSGSSDNSAPDFFLLDPNDGAMTRTTDTPGGIWNISPNGERVFVVSEDQGKLFVEDIGGSNSIQLANTPWINDVAWSPDGLRISFSAGMMASKEIYVVDASGKNEPIRLTKNNRQDVAPAWSPDGKYIAFGSSVIGPSNHPATGLYVINANGSDNEAKLAAPLVRINNAREISWSSDGTHIVMTAAMADEDYRGGSLYMVNANGEKLVRLINLPEGSIWRPRWSPDDTQIAFSSSIYDNTTKTDSRNSYLIDTDGNKLRTLSPEGFDCYILTWQS